MLRELLIRNLAVVEEVRVPFAPGLNVLTGETGAGKSILIDAILLVIGARAHPDKIRSGAETATVEACFELSDGDPVTPLLEAAGHRAGDGQLVVKRELSRSGRNRVFVNDSAATTAFLERLGDLLVEVHGQHEHQRLMEPARQLDVLDRFAEGQAMRDRVGALVARWAEAHRRAAQMREEAREHGQREDLHRFQLSEIDAAQLREGEEEELRNERRRLQHAGRIAAGLHEVIASLHEDAQAAVVPLGRALSLLRDLAKLDGELAAPAETLESARAHLEEVVDRVRTARDRVDLDPRRLEEVDDRLDALVRLKRKYGDTVSAILARREEIAAALDRVGRHEELLAQLEEEIRLIAEEAAVEALRLSEARSEAASRLERLIQRELRSLGMDQARFRIAVGHEHARPGELACGAGSWRVGPRGADVVEFLLSANPGEDLRPLAKVVSGGELSRTMLGVKAVLAASDRVPIMVFDEVDAGIGGRVAEVVGQRLRLAAAGRQVLCVTHLGPIAAYAQHHLRVDKRLGKTWTRTTVAPLDEAARIEELARMVGGQHITDATRRHARELFRTARAME